jgi:tetratricopeptide (TPR) repeat protein
MALDNPDIQRQREVILRVLIKSITQEQGVTVRELEKDTQSDDEVLYTRRHTQRILRDVYDEAFFEVDKIKNKTLQPYSSVFSPHYMPDLEYIDLFNKLTQSHKKVRENPAVFENMLQVVNIRTLFPEYFEDLLEFRRMALDTLKDVEYENEMGRLLYSELAEVTESLQIFFNHYQSILSVGWFRSRRENIQNQLLEDQFPWKYTADDARKVRVLLLRLTKSQKHSFSIMFYGALTLVKKGLIESALIVYKECLNFEIDPREIGIVHENIATLYRMKGNSKLMIGEMKLALDYFIESGEQYRIGVALKNLGEAEWMYGQKDAANRYFKQAEEIGETLDGLKKFGIYWNLASSASRINNKQMEIDYLSKSLKSCPDEFPERILQIDRRLDELTRY